MDTVAPSRTRRLSFEDLRAFPALFRTYCTEFERLAAYYAGDWQRAEARRAAATRAAEHPRDRDAVVEVLLEQNERWGLNDATRAHLDALRRPETVAVVTGQQVGLFGGPLYTPYKTITTIQLARQLAEETGRPVVPVFWLEGGDHDLEEVASVKVLRQNELEVLRYTGHTLPEHGNLGPVGRLAFTEQITEVVDQLDAVLPPSDFHDEVLAAVRAAYQPGTTFLDAFGRLMRRLFPDAGLVFLDPDDARFKQLAVPLFRRELEDYETADAALHRVSETLSRDFHAQVHPRPTNLFLCDGAGRHPIDADGDGFRLRDTDRQFGRQELIALLEADPACFSPNVVLRPLMQDVLVPTAAYVGGPGEISYFAQFKPVYAWAGVPMPIIYPRASVSLVEPKIQKVLDRYGLTVADFDEDLERLFQRVVRATMEVDVEAVFKEAGRHLHEAVNGLKPEVEQVDRTLVKAAEASRAAFMKELNRLKGRVLRAEKHKHDEERAQLEKGRVNLFPGGSPQERALSVLYFLNKYGPDLLDRLTDELSLATDAHQALAL